MQLKSEFLICAAATVALLILVSPDGSAQNRALQNRLKEATRLDCRFTKIATADWDGANATIDVEAQNLEVAFFDIDVEEGTAEAESEYGASYIALRYSTGYLHLMQMFNAGPLYVTTVMAQETEDGRLMATQSRVEYSRIVMPGYTSRPEFYVGDCSLS